MSSINDQNQDSSNNRAGQLRINYVFLIAYLAGLSAFGSFVNDMYLPSLPSMMHFFGCSVSMVQMGLTMGMIGLALGQLVLGPVSDHYGRKPVLGYSLALFIVAAVVSIWSPTIHFFLICRLIQGMGASGAYFLARTIPADIYTGRSLAKTMAVIGAINGFAPACSPVLGGFISARFDWQGVFVVLVAFAVILLIISPRMKETLPPDRRVKGKLADSFKNYLGLCKNRAFMTHVLLKGSALGLLFAYISSAPFIIQTRYGFSQEEFGLIIGANAIGVVVGSMTALKFRLLKRAAFVGALILIVATIAESAAMWMQCRFLWYEILLIPMLFALGMIFTVSNTLAMNEGRKNAGDASAVLGIAGYVFGAAVSPLVGIGNIMHSTAIAFVCISIIVLVSALMSRRLVPDLN